MAITLRQKKAMARLAVPMLRVAKMAMRALGFLPARLARRPRLRLPLPRSASIGAAGVEPRRILVIRLDSIGDVLLSEPAVAALRARYPTAVLDVAVGSLGKAVLEGNPAIDELVVYEAPWHAAWRGSKVSWRREAAALWRATSALRRRRYDLIVELRGDFRDIVFALLCGSRAVVGCGWRGGGSLLDYDVPLDTRVHQVDFGLAIAAAAGADPTPRSPRLVLGVADHRAADTLLAGLVETTLVGIHLGAGFPSKCLPVAKVAGAARGLLARWRPDLGPRPTFVVVGSAEEKGAAEAFRDAVPGPVLDATGRLSIKGTAALLGRCDLFIGNDSGPMHLAAATGTPIVTYFGPSEPFRFHPYGVPYRLLEVDLACRPCDFVHCAQAEFKCLSLLEEDRIIQAAEQLLAGRTAREAWIR